VTTQQLNSSKQAILAQIFPKQKKPYLLTQIGRMLRVALRWLRGRFAECKQEHFQLCATGTQLCECLPCLCYQLIGKRLVVAQHTLQLHQGNLESHFPIGDTSAQVEKGIFVCHSTSLSVAGL
jgi:hypothetical protein